MTWAIPIASLIIAGTSLVLSTFLASRSVSRSASAEWVHSLEERVATCERERARLAEELKRLRDRELDLMRRLFKLENGGSE